MYTLSSVRQKTKISQKERVVIGIQKCLADSLNSDTIHVTIFS